MTWVMGVTAQEADAIGSDSLQETAGGGGKAPRVALLTVDPGPVIYELDGHTALRFTVEGQYDYIVNWGVFDFNSPNFLYRFVKGETDYMAWPFPYEMFIDGYRLQGREVTEQTLNLSPTQARELESMVTENLRPENRTYRYNYIYDNCATRPLALVEKAAGMRIEIPDFRGFTYGETGIEDTDSIHTFRREMARSHADYPWYQFGIDLALGNGLDKQITNRERTYYPLYLREALRHACFIGPDGSRIPVVTSSEIVLHGDGRVTEPSTPFLLSPLSAALTVLLITLAVTIRDIRRRKVSRLYDSLFNSAVFLVSLLLTFLIFISVHEASSPNWLYLWLNPFSLVPAAFIWLKSCKRVVYCYQICNFAALFLLLLIGIAGHQELNRAFYPLMVSDMMLSARYIFINRSLRAVTEKDRTVPRGE